MTAMMYLLPRFVSGKGPNKSVVTDKNGSFARMYFIWPILWCWRLFSWHYKIFLKNKYTELIYSQKLLVLYCMYEKKYK